MCSWAGDGSRTLAGALGLINEGLQNFRKLRQTKAEVQTQIHLRLSTTSKEFETFAPPMDMPLLAYLKESEQPLQERLGCRVADMRFSYFPRDDSDAVTVATARCWQNFFKYVSESDKDTVMLYLANPALGRLPVPPVPPLPPVPLPQVQPLAAPKQCEQNDGRTSLTDVVSKMKDKRADKLTLQKIDKLSTKLRNHWKSMFFDVEPSVQELQQTTAELEKLGFANFQSNAQVFEELGIDAETWADKVDEMVDMGLPDKMGKVLKMAVKNRRGSNKSTYHSLWIPDEEAGMLKRVTYSQRLRCIPVGEEGFDIIFAVNQSICELPDDEDSKSGRGPKADQLFKTYLRLDSEVEFKAAVKLLLPDDSSGKAGPESGDDNDGKAGK